MSGNIIETVDLCYTYEGSDRRSLDKVSLGIQKGSKTVILGANGAGKSTLFYQFNGVNEPEEGEVLFDGEPVVYKRKPLRALRSRVAVVLQNPDDQIFGQTVEADVAYGPTNIGLSNEEIEERVASALHAVGLEDFRKRVTGQLSYGQRRRLALAGALAMRPEILVLDEPTAGMDPRMAHDVMELTNQLNASGTTVVISTHDVDLAYSWAEEIHVLIHGRIEFSGSPEEFYSDPARVRVAGLAVPLVQSMNFALADSGAIDAHPYPRTEAHLVAKLKSGPRGKLRVSVTDGVSDASALDSVRGGARAGVYGSAAKSQFESMEYSVDYTFNAVELCALDCLDGGTRSCSATPPRFRSSPTRCRSSTPSVAGCPTRSRTSDSKPLVSHPAGWAVRPRPAHSPIPAARHSNARPRLK